MEHPFWQDRRVLVTGAAGLLGSRLVAELVRREADLTAIVRDYVPRSPFHSEGLSDKVTVAHGDLASFEFVLRAVNESQADTIFHLAAQTQVRVANVNPLSTFSSNIAGTWNVLEAARLCEKWVKRVVVASSDKAYGAQEKLPYTEEQPLLGRNPYDASKACADLLAQSYEASYGLPVAITRLANLFGPGDVNFDRLIPDVCRALARGKVPVIRSDGSPVRDYLYIDDAVAAYLLLAERLREPGVRGEAFNFGNERPQTVLEVTRALIAAAGKGGLEPVIEGQGLPAGEIARQYLSAEKARKVLGWKAEWGFEEALAETWRWYEGNFGGI